jgi:histidine ammonia-lyase
VRDGGVNSGFMIAQVTAAAVAEDQRVVRSGVGFNLQHARGVAEVIETGAHPEVGAISERRLALLLDTGLSGLPPFLVRDGGVN